MDLDRYEIDILLIIINLATTNALNKNGNSQYPVSRTEENQLRSVAAHRIRVRREQLRCDEQNRGAQGREARCTEHVKLEHQPGQDSIPGHVPFAWNQGRQGGLQGVLGD